MPSSIEKELLQTHPFASRDEAAIVALARTSDVVFRAANRVTSGEGLSTEQYNVLRILRGARADGMATVEISKRMVQRDPGITRLLDKLEKKKLVVRKRCKEDRRKVLCSITEAGGLCLGRLERAIAPVTKTCMSGLSRAEKESFLEMLARIREKSNLLELKHD